MPETYANIPLFVAQMKYILPITIISIIAFFAWATYQDRKFKKEKETKTCS